MQCYLYIKRNKLYMQRSTGITVLNMHWLQISDALAVIENKSRDSMILFKVDRFRNFASLKLFV